MSSSRASTPIGARPRLPNQGTQKEMATPDQRLASHPVRPSTFTTSADPQMGLSKSSGRDPGTAPAARPGATAIEPEPRGQQPVVPEPSKQQATECHAES